MHEVQETTKMYEYNRVSNGTQGCMNTYGGKGKHYLNEKLCKKLNDTQ